jgi:hypothetical protein
LSFSLLATLGLDAAGFESGLLLEEKVARAAGKKIKRGLSGEDVGGGSKGLFGAVAEHFIGVAALYKAGELVEEGVKKAVEMAHEVRAISQDIGSSTDMIQVYAETFDGTEHLTTAFKSLAEAREKAMRGGPAAEKFIQDFARLGVSMDDLRAKNMDELFHQVGEQIKGATIDGRELANVAEVLGKSGVNMIDGFKRGLTEVHAEMAKKGEIISAADIRALEDAHRELDSIGRQINVIFSKATVGVMDFFRVSFGKPVTPITNFAAAEEVQNRRAETRAAAQEKFDSDHKAAMDEVAGLDAKTAEIQYEELSNDEKRKVLAERRLEIEKELSQYGAAAAADDAGKILAAQLRQQLEQVKLEFAKIHADKVTTDPYKESHLAHHERQDVNAAQRVGAYVYQAETASLQKQSNQTLIQIHHELVKIRAGGGHF